MSPDQIVILADESAGWRVAGLTQLERLRLAINEFAETEAGGRKIDICIFWKPNVLVEQRSVPRSARVARCELHVVDNGVGLSGAPILSTHVLVARDGVGEAISSGPFVRDEHSTWDELSGSVVNSNACAARRRIAQAGEIPEAERWLLRSVGKPQDGVVAKFINRPISRALSRLLLKTLVTPNAWTLSILALPMAGFLFLCRGDYPGFVAGALVFQLFSILDGCDGEIARAKYLESERGRSLDNFCDVIGNILFAVGLGLGLQRSHGGSYAIEGSICAAAIAVSEWLLADTPSQLGSGIAVLNETFYPRHRAMLQRAGLLFVPEKFWTLLFQVTKRDVAILLFLLLAMASQARWILHVWTLVAAVSLLFALIARLRAR
jgi:phosphatidylglycerophosphate synthase